MHVIRSVGVISVAKIMALIHASFGLLLMPIFLLAGFLSMMGRTHSEFGGAVSVVIAVLMPIFYGLMGFVMGAIGALLYNLFANLIGGIEVQVTAPAPQSLM